MRTSVNADTDHFIADRDAEGVTANGMVADGVLVKTFLFPRRLQRRFVIGVSPMGDFGKAGDSVYWHRLMDENL
ncbi:MAG: hypothetical protein ACE3JU_11570 [Paenibacillus sp.]|uniref:hypothetical protein n=1 Tax=Paenibacillus sp. TaxID=58172 RepID=UPI003B817D9A